MKRAFNFLLFFILFCNVCITAQEVRVMESLSMYSKILGQEIKYSICLPEGYYNGNKKYPVVYMLHGLGGNESAWLEYGGISQFADRAVRDKEIIPMIYVMPQGFKTYYVNDYAGTYQYQDMLVKELLPFIDSVYRTKGGKSRATIGYSMGGFGALVVPLEHPELFTACVPLSVSIRTDQQYMTEDSSGWNDQWGKLFGGVGTIGGARITDYYKQHSPMHMLAQKDPATWKGLGIYIDNGDDEQTLAFSNEELHHLLRDRNISHEYRVRDGGHEFDYWRSALHNGLRFISDALEGKQYRGDIELATRRSVRNSDVLLKPVGIEDIDCNAYFPAEYYQTKRLYPVVYVMGDLLNTDQSRIANVADRLIKKGEVAPFIIVFVSDKEKQLLGKIIPAIENNYRGRPGFRFKSLLLIGKGAWALEYALRPETFTSCTIMEPSVDQDVLKTMITATEAKKIERTWFFIGNSDKSPFYKNTGSLHMLLREKDIYHEYRVMQGTINDAWKQSFLEEAFRFTIKKVHR